MNDTPVPQARRPPRDRREAVASTLRIIDLLEDIGQQSPIALSDRERGLLIRRSLGQTLEVAAGKYGLARSRAQQIHAKALKKIDYHCSRMDIPYPDHDLPRPSWSSRNIGPEDLLERGLSTRVANALAEAGIDSFEALKACSDHDLDQVYGLGEIGRASIHKVLSSTE